MLVLLKTLGSLCDAVAVALAAGAIDEAVMDYLLTASRPRVDGHAVLCKAGRSWVSKYMRSMSWKRLAIVLIYLVCCARHFHISYWIRSG